MRNAFILFLTFWISSSSASLLSEGIIQGEASLDKKCKASEIQIWVSQDRNLVYQISVPSGGSYQFHVIPGKYTLTAFTEEGCHDRKEVEVKNSEVQKTNLSMTSKKRNPASYPELSQPSCMCVMAPCNCEEYLRRPSYVHRSWYPWWANYGSYYPYFYYPGVWGSYGLNPVYYPGYHPVGLAKPNVYFSGKKGLNSNLRVKLLDSKDNWLVSTPIYNPEGWNFKIVADSAIEVEKVNYPFLYYDLRVSDKGLQSAAGFCEERNKAIEKMSQILKTSGFKKNEIKDFESHWRIKMPPDAVCVFPQTQTELDKVAGLEVTPKPSKVTRMVFAVATKESILSKGLGTSFQKLPEKEWFSSKQENRTPSSKDTFEVREWGVAFFFEKTQN